MDQMLAPLRKYADFHGRATRSEYWMFFLFRVLLFFGFCIPIAGLFMLDNPAGDANAEPGVASMVASAIMILGFLTYLALLIPELAVTVRRFHDQDLSGWLVLLNLVASFIVLIFMLLPGTRGTNRHGPDPRAPAEHTASVFA